MPPNDDLTGFSSDIPPDFDPCAHPVIAQHWFGLAALPQQDDTGAFELADEDVAA